MQLKQLLQAFRVRELESLFDSAPPLSQPRKNAAGTALEYAISSGLIASLSNLPFTTTNQQEQIAHTITIPANTLTQIGQHLEFIQAASASGTSGSGTIRIRLDGLSGTLIGSSTVSLNQHSSANRRLYYLSSTTGLISNTGNPDFASAAGSWSEPTINWQQTQTFVITLQASTTNVQPTLRMSTVRLFI